MGPERQFNRKRPPPPVFGRESCPLSLTSPSSSFSSSSRCLSMSSALRARCSQYFLSARVLCRAMRTPCSPCFSLWTRAPCLSSSIFKISSCCWNAFWDASAAAAFWMVFSLSVYLATLTSTSSSSSRLCSLTPCSIACNLASFCDAREVCFASSSRRPLTSPRSSSSCLLLSSDVSSAKATRSSMPTFIWSKASWTDLMLSCARCSISDTR
mmetsp:Transcript_9369/g.24060  ORF Transcript_9369/g.24060 Transcript_9369/m.24060 type:complete len:212 (-) Transcript_9369:384-1019(-)